MLAAPFPMIYAYILPHLCWNNARGVLELWGKKIAELGLSNSAVFSVSICIAQ